MSEGHRGDFEISKERGALAQVWTVRAELSVGTAAVAVLALIPA